MILRFAVLSTMLLAALSCESPLPDRVRDIHVPDSALWTRSVLCTYHGSSQSYSYTGSEPAIVWGFEPPDGNGGWKRSKGFAEFSLLGVEIAPENVRSCTLHFFMSDSGIAPTNVRGCHVDIPETPDSLLYQLGGSLAIVALDSILAPGWHKVALSEPGVGHIRDCLRTGLTRSGYCWDYPGTDARNASASGHEVAQRPYLSIVYSDTAR
jgi:hypothetical protein